MSKRSLDNTTGTTRGSELLTIPYHLSSPSGFSGVRVAWSLVFCAVFCRCLFVPLYFFFCPLCCMSSDVRFLITPLVDRGLSLCTFSFIHCVVCPPLMYGFLSPLWYLQTFLMHTRWTQQCRFCQCMITILEC